MGLVSCSFCGNKSARYTLRSDVHIIYLCEHCLINNMTFALEDMEDCDRKVATVELVIRGSQLIDILRK